MDKDIERVNEVAALEGDTEGARRATGVSPSRAAAPEAPTSGTGPDPEVLEKPARRRFTAEYKLQILKEAEAGSEHGEIGALLRREGLYSSHLTAWRGQRDQGSLRALAPSKRGRKPKAKNPLSDEVARLERENRKLQKRLGKAELIIDFQKKVAALLGTPLANPPGEESE
jgi:transposase-like protein